MNAPIIVLNFKTYKQATGKNAIKLAKIADSVARRNKKVRIYVAVQAVDIEEVAKSVSIPVLAQHVDLAGLGQYTGLIAADAVKKAGAIGTLLNHSEHPLSIRNLGLIVKQCKKLKLKTFALAQTPKMSEKAARFNPDFIAVEPSELIGGKVSVSEAKPEVVRNAVKRVHRIKKIPVLCGAGVHSGVDVKKALELGASGVLLASAYCLAKNPKKVLLDLLGLI